jgi:hypothetical protein
METIGFEDRTSLKHIIGVFAVTAFLLSPFIWSYVGYIGNTLIRVVDVVFLVLMVSVFVSGKIARFPPLVPLLLLGLSALLVVRALAYGDWVSAVSGVKISYYLAVALALATAIRYLMRFRMKRSLRSALILVSPIFALFFYTLVVILFELLSTPSSESYSRFVFEFWHKVFSENLFGSEGGLVVQGVSFRNSAGLAFFVSSLFFYVVKEKMSDVIAFFLFFVAALFFSRSVWLFQVLFVILLLVGSGSRGRGLFLLVGSLGVIGLLSAPAVWDVLWERLSSNLGRGAILSAGITLFCESWVLGWPEGVIVSVEGVDKVVHNVPLAFGLKLGVVGLFLSMLIQLIFFVSFLGRMYCIKRRHWQTYRINVVLAVSSSILFFRPFLSASHEIYFSIGEWLAFSLFLGLSGSIKDFSLFSRQKLLLFRSHQPSPPVSL